MKGTNKMMTIAAAAVLLCSGCNEMIYETAPAPAGVASNMTQENWSDSVDVYRCLARGGDAAAYLRLAHCHHKGLGVRHDFVDMLSMVAMAKAYGIRDAWEVFIDELPAGDPDRILVEALYDMSRLRRDEAMQKATMLVAMGDPAADLIMGAAALEHQDKEEAKRLFGQAADKGNRLAYIFLSLLSDKKEDQVAVAVECPIMYSCLAEECLENDENPSENVIADYYLKAYDALCLPPEGARWLLAYYERQAQAGLPTADDATISNMKQMVGKYEECRMARRKRMNSGD